jgi:hypothetical protein
MNRLKIGDDAWTYNQFGTRTMYDQIRAAVLHERDQLPDPYAIGSGVREQPSGSAFPVVPIGKQGIPLKAESVDPHRISSVSGLLLPVDREQNGDTLADFMHLREYLTEMREAVARSLAQDITDAFLTGRFHIGRVPVAAHLAETVHQPTDHL